MGPDDSCFGSCSCFGSASGFDFGGVSFSCACACVELDCPEDLPAGRVPAALGRGLSSCLGITDPGCPDGVWAFGVPGIWGVPPVDTTWLGDRCVPGDTEFRRVWLLHLPPTLARPLKLKADISAFYAILAIFNLAAFASYAANSQIAKNQAGKNNKYEYKASRFTILAVLKPVLPSLLFLQSAYLRRKLLRSILPVLSARPVPVRKDRPFDRSRSILKYKHYP